MTYELEFIRPDEKAALVALSTPEWLEATRNALAEIGYKVHAASNHEDFMNRFTRIQYHVVVLEELFGAQRREDNQSLSSIQEMPMHQRRHTVLVLLGDSFQTLNPMQAFQQSVHAVVNRREVDPTGPNAVGPSILGPIIQRIVADNDLLLATYRETQRRLAQGKA